MRHSVLRLLPGLAANPGLGLPLLAPLFGSDDRATLVALAGRGDLTSTAALALARRDDPEIGLALAQNPAAAVHAWPVLVGSPDARIRAGLAAGHRDVYRRRAEEPPLPARAQERLARDPDPEVRRGLGYRRDLTAAAGHRLVADDDTGVRVVVATHWRPLPEPALRALLGDPEAVVRRHALLGTVPPQDLVAALLADPRTRQEAAGVARLGAADLAGLLTDPDPAVRAGVAGNATVAAASLAVLAGDPDEEVRAALMLRPGLSDDLRTRVAATVRPWDHHVAPWLLPSAAPLEVRLAHVGSPFVFCRRAVAFSPDLPPWAVERLAADGDHSVRLLLAEHHPDAPGHILAGLVRTTGHAKWDLARHPNMPAADLADLAASDDPAVRLAAASGPNLPPAAADDLARHDDREIRLTVAANPALPQPGILRLLDDPDPRVAASAAGNPALPADAAARLIRAAR
ncbi:hypothetical protein [Dactylosporangium fulvum]|nr:hypothetical protein [Dactylosporangium fulvum]